MNEEDIYSSVPKDAIEPGFTEQKDKVLRLLKTNPKVFFNARVIAKTCGFPIRGTQVEVRNAITMLIEPDQQPIVSNAKGFAYTEDPNMIDFYARSLEERLAGLERRIRSVRKIYHKLLS